MGIADPTPEGRPSQSRTSPASTRRAGRPVKEEHPMFDTLQVTKELRESGLAEPQAEAIVVAFGAIAGNVLTKDDLEDFATRDDLKDFATKDDLKGFATKDDLKNFATKDDLKGFATKDDLKNFATKDDLKDLEARMATKDDLKALEEKMATKDDLKHFVTEAGMHKAFGEFSEKIHRSLLQVAMGTVTVNIAMVTAIFVVAKYLF